MRAGGCSVQQALTNDAANIVKQAVTLAKRRGHAQVTPLHVANTMLSAPSGLLRAACLQSHSHPLQCKALELCFNVALNRLPASSSSPMLGPAHSQYPSISNALVAAFKRAQAHQRRGTIENQQQQPVLAVKIELEQLIISILDDPSVSRVMREAGFSSTQVKINVEKSVSLETTPQNSPPCSQNDKKIGKVTETEQIRGEDVEIIIDNMQKNKSLVIVGEFISSIESAVKGLMSKVDKGEVNDDLKEVKFITIPPLYTFCNLQRNEVDQKIGELSCLVKSLVSKGVVLYLGDLKWVSEYRVNLEQENYYCSVEHMIMELGKFVCGINNGRFWLLGIATFQTYMRCRNGYNSLESVWGLHPVTIPANSLGLSLISDHNRDEQNDVRNGRLKSGSRDMQQTNGGLKLTCCAVCSVKFEAEARKLQERETNVGRFDNLPPWLKDETTRLGRKDEKPDYLMEELYKKWNSYCNTSHKQQLGRTLTFPSSSISCFSLDHLNPNLNQNPHFTTWKENFQLWPFHSNTSSNPNSTTSSSDNLMETDHYIPKFKEFNAQNLNILCNALEKLVPWQKQIIPDIVGTILQCRSGMIKRKLENLKSNHHIKEETWLFFLGLDTLAKERISRELAKAVFGTYSNFVTIAMSNFNDNDDLRNKRGRDEESCNGYMERFAEAVWANPHRVFFLEDLEQMDYMSQMSIKRAIESGGICRESGDEVSFCDAIVILSSESFNNGRSRGVSPRQKIEHNNGDEGIEEERVCLDLNISCDNYSTVDQCGDGLGILETVDRRLLFKIHDF